MSIEKNEVNIEATQFKFENLMIWQKAMEIGEDIHKLAYRLPEEEKFNLASQIRRAADSVALNISERAIEQTAPEFRRFMGFSIRSLAEVVTCLHKMNRRKYISEQQFKEYYQSCFHLMNMMIAFRNELK